MTLKTGISGLRGTVDGTGDQLTAEAAVRWTQAYVARLRARGAEQPRVVLGRDGRRSSPAVAALVRGALLTAGADVTDLGPSLTPVVQFATRSEAGFDGGVMVTASHNTAEWNGLKFVDGEGLFLPMEEWDAMAALLRDDALPAVSLDRAGSVTEAGEVWWERHRRAVLSAAPTEEVAARGLRIVLDACNSGAIGWVPALELLGCQVEVLHGAQAGVFERGPEPVPRNLGLLRDRVRESGADLGFAADPDGDRLVLVDGDGGPVSEEATVVLCALAVARPGDTVVANVVTTHALDEALEGVRVVRSRVGEANVVAATTAHGAVLGGEGSGGVILPRVHLARDGLVAGSLVLALMARTGRSLAELVASLPRWTSVKGAIPAPADGGPLLAALGRTWTAEPPTVHAEAGRLVVEGGPARFEATWSGNSVEVRVDQPEGAVATSAEVPGLGAILDLLTEGALTADLTDGLKVTGAGAWFSLRASNTEPIFRLMGELREPVSALVLFEDEAVERLLPLVWTRPVFELRCGILTLREAVEHAYGVAVSAQQVRPHLAAVAQRRSGIATTPPDGDVLMLNGRVLATSGLAEAVAPTGDARVFRTPGGDVLALRLPAGTDTDPDDLPVTVVDQPMLERPWDLFGRNAERIGLHAAAYTQRVDQGQAPHLHGVHVLEPGQVHVAADATVQPGVVLDATDGPIVIDEGATVMAGAVIQGPAYVGPGAQVKIGAKIYHGTTIGPHCKVGGEVEETVFQGWSNKQHDGFLGHAYLGEWCNLGAGTSNSDLKNNYGHVRVWDGRGWCDTGLRSVGVMMADHSKTGINSSLNTGTVVGVACNLFGAGLPPKHVPSFSWGSGTELVEHDLQAALATARTVMARRGRELDDAEADLLRHVFAATAPERP